MFRFVWRGASAGSASSNRASSRRQQGRSQVAPLSLRLEELESRALLAATAFSLANAGLVADTAGGSSNSATISADGRYVAYQSNASNIIQNETNPSNFSNIYLYDSQLKTTTLVSHSTSSTLPIISANGDSFGVTMSSDGRYLAFASTASDLVAGQVENNSGADIFLYDRLAPNSTILVSHVAFSNVDTANNGATAATISANGNYIVYASLATNVVAGQVDTNNANDVFLYDRVADTNRLLSGVNSSPTTTGNGASDGPVISGNGNFIAFRSDANNLVPGGVDSNTASDVFLFNRAAGVTSIISHNNVANNVTGDAASDTPVINSDGTFIAFRSLATNLVTGQVKADGTESDVFVFTRTSSALTLVSHAAGMGATTGDGGSDSPVIAGDISGTFIAYRSLATDLVFGQIDTNAVSDVFLYNVTTPANPTALVSRTPTSSTTTGNDASDAPALSSDTSTVLFRSYATNLVPALTSSNVNGDLYSYSRTSQVINLVSRNDQSASTTGNNGSYTAPAQTYPPARPATTTMAGYPPNPMPMPLSGDGKFVAFTSFATDLVNGLQVTNGYDNVYLYSSATLGTTLVSQRTATLPSATAGGDSTTSTSRGNSTSSDGQVITFVSKAANLVPGQSDGNFSNDVFVEDRVAGTITLVSHTAASVTQAGDGVSSTPSISSDGRYITYVSNSTNLLAVPVTGTNIYIYDRVTGVNTLVSHNNANSAPANADSSDPIISSDGNSVVFVSLGTDLIGGQIDTNGMNDVFVYDRASGAIALVSGMNSSATVTGNAASDGPSISDDGSFIAFRSDSTNLVSGQVDNNKVSDVFLFDLSTGTGQTKLVSHISSLPLITASGGSDSPVISGDGAAVAYVSRANNLAAGQMSTLGLENVFLFQRTTNANTLVSHTASSSVKGGNGMSTSPAISLGGSFVTYLSLATDLVLGQTDTNSLNDVFEYSTSGDSNSLVSHSASSSSTAANAESFAPIISQDGRSVAYTSLATDLVSGQIDTPASTDVFVYDRVDAGKNTLVSANPSNPVQTGNKPSDTPILSPDGGVVGFSSQATDLVANDLNASQDTFFFTLTRIPTDIVLSNNTVPEFQPVGTTVGTLSTIDPNPGVGFSYSLVPGSGSTDNASFMINGDQLQTAAVFDINAQSTYSIRVRTTDSAGLSTEKVFTINVIFFNVAPTDILLSNSSVPELSPVGTMVGTFSTVDLNAGDTFTYSLVAGPGGTDNSAFTINGDVLQTATTLDFNTKNVYSIRVRTTDAGGLTFDKVFTINVLQVPRPPTAITLNPDQVRDLSPAGTVVGVLDTVSPNAGVTFTYALVPGTGADDNGFFSINGNTLVTNDLTGASRINPPYSVRIQSTDSNGLTVEQVFVIPVRRALTEQTIGMFDQASGTWFLRNSNSNGPPDAGTFRYGETWQPVVGDWDGDGVQTIGVVDPKGGSDPDNAVWYLRNSNTNGPPNFTPFPFGLRSWKPVAGDWSDVGHTGIGMFDPTSGVWFLRNDISSGGPDFVPFAYGLGSWIPVVGDWDGNGTTTVGVVDPTTMTWYLRNSNNPGQADLVFQYGLPGWKPVVGDWNGDGKTDLGVVDPNGVWYQVGVPNPYQYGLGSWLPVGGDWDYPALPLKASNGGVPSGHAATLTDAELSTAVTDALARLQNAGVSAEVLNALSSATYLVSSLPTGYLGETSSSAHRVWISSDAAGNGWFTDGSLASDALFNAQGKALPNSPAANKTDLATVLLHEMGHLVGHGDLDSHDHPNDLMADFLPNGERRLSALDTVFSSLS